MRFDKPPSLVIIETSRARLWLEVGNSPMGSLWSISQP